MVLGFSPTPTGNRLLNLLPPDEYAALRPHLREGNLAHGKVIYEPRRPIEIIYFPTSAVLSAVTVMVDGHLIEVATTGNEGVSGLPAFGVVTNSPHRVMAQIPGAALSADAEAINRELLRLPRFRETITKYHQAFVFQISQCVACNGLHMIEQRCCRWLLMTHDRVEGDEMKLTHEYLSYMLGVRRPSVTEVLQSLQEQGLIRSGKGKITILDRKRLQDLSCECYQHIRDEYESLLG
jgi:CRP-like cAMP-binding protein